MSLTEIIIAALLGLVEGITEFLPVSSTAHLLLLSHFTGFSTSGKTFEVLIQLGAILAVLGVYVRKIIYLISNFYKDPQARFFVFGLIIAFLPAAIIGLLAHDIIKQVFFETPVLICSSLIIGGVILLVVDKMDLKPKYHDAEQYPLWAYLVIGFGQCLAMIPGTSRSGATVVAAMLLGSDKRSAAEFSFFLAMPTMAGAFAVDLYKNYNILTSNDLSLIAVGFITAFFSAVFVVRTLLNYVTRHGFAPFAYWRICVGSLGLTGLYFLS